MRRIILAVTGTVAGLVALLSFRSHVPSAAPTASTGSSSSATSGSSGSGSGSSGSGSGSSSVSSIEYSKKFPVPAGGRAIDGNVANTVYGPVQVQALVSGSKIVDVNILEQPSSTIHDLQLGQMAFPQLISETVRQQSANIDSVSGASYTSAGYIKSLQSALDNGA
jgi:uncharacterized protein with FMN-binding domain